MIPVAKIQNFPASEGGTSPLDTPRARKLQLHQIIPPNVEDGSTPLALAYF